MTGGGRADASASRKTPNPWHAGEVAMQRANGAAEALAELGPRVVRDHLIAQHRAFFPLLPTIVLGTVDAHGDAWATLRAGRPGFVQAPDAWTLRVDLRRDGADPAQSGIVDDAAIGVLGLDPVTRRRNRVNGDVAHATGDGFDVRVRQSFGNCPKYIHQRDTTFTRDPAVVGTAATIETVLLDEVGADIVRGADTFFVASYVDLDGSRQVDVSHRGGRPGFVDIGGDGGLTIPDFAGNRFFNTLGNFTVNPKAGLVFADFRSGDLLQLTGDARVSDRASTTALPDGIERTWTFRPRRVVRRPGALPVSMRLRPDGQSPYVLAMGEPPR